MSFALLQRQSMPSGFHRDSLRYRPVTCSLAGHCAGLETASSMSSLADGDFHTRGAIRCAKTSRERITRVCLIRFGVWEQQEGVIYKSAEDIAYSPFMFYP